MVGPFVGISKDSTVGGHRLQSYHAAWENEKVDLTGFFRATVLSLVLSPRGPIQFTELILKFFRFKNGRVAKRGNLKKI